MANHVENGPALRPSHNAYSRLHEGVGLYYYFLRIT